MRVGKTTLDSQADKTAGKRQPRKKSQFALSLSLLGFL
jgi:hypothetical protein